MIKIGQRCCQFIFFVCLAAVLSWRGQGISKYFLHWDPGQPAEPSLLFSAQDSLTWASIASHDKTLAERQSSEKNIIAVFDKLTYQALLEKCRGNAPGSQAYFQRAELAADYFKEFFQNSLLLESARLYCGMTGDALKTKLIAERLYYRGYELFSRSKIEEAKNSLNAGYQLYAEFQDTKRLTELAFHLSYIALVQGDYSQCHDLAMVTLRKATAEKYNRLTRWLHWLIGASCLNLSNYDEARKEFEIALKLAESGKDSLLSARAYERLGVTFWSQGDFLKALEAVQRSQHLSHQINDQHAEINYLIELGMINRRLGNYTEASQCYEKAYNLNRILAQPQLSAIINNNWAGLYIELGDWQRALDLQIRALEDEPRAHANLLAVRLSTVGLIYSKLNDNPKALSYQRLALRELGKDHSFASEEALIYLRMGDIYGMMGQIKEAENSYQIAFRITEHIKEAMAQIHSLLGLGDLYRKGGKFTQALSLQSQALKLAQQTRSPELEWNAALELGKTYETHHNIDLAQQAYEEALEKVETSRTKISADTLRMSFFAIKQDVYDRLTALHLEARSDPEAALHYSERSRARTMLDIIGERFHQRQFICDIPRLTDLQRLMASEMVFVEYKLLPDKLVIWAVKKDTLKVATVPVSRQELAQLVRDFLDAIGASNFDRFRERFAKEPQALFEESSKLGARLYNYFVAPIEKYLSSQQVIYFVPDEILYYLPFAALTVPDADQQQFLIEKYKIAYMPSLTVYSYLANRHPNKLNKHSPRMLAIGNPTGDLWNSEQEVKSIAGLFSASKILIREQATERAVVDGLQSDFDYFHFAGHCQINEKSPMYSALLLYKNQTAGSFNSYSSDGINEIVDDGMLTVNDLLSCSLDHIELATLSACETALGKLSKGEGMMGLSQVLLGSGIPTLVSSLWKVDDRNSAELTQRFYHYLASGKYNKLEALRQAQLDKIAWCGQDKIVQYPFPYFWASYILSGMTP